MSLFGNVVRILTGEPYGDAPKYVYGPVDNVEGWPGYEPGLKVQPGTRYAQLFLAEMWVRNARAWLNDYYPLVYTVVKTRFGDSEVEIPATAGEFNLGGRKFTDLTDAIKLNYPMTPLLPYNGGLVEVTAALMKMREKDGLKSLLKAVGEFSELLMIPQLSTAIEVAAPFASTLEAVFGDGKEQFELGLHQSFRHGGEEEIREGYFIAAKVDGRLDRNELAVVDGQLKLASDKVTPVREFDYMLFRLETHEERDDYEGLKAIFSLLEDAESTDMSTEDGIKKAKALIVSAKFAAWRSPDLTSADRVRVPGMIQKRFDSFLAAIGVTGSGAGVDAAVADMKIRDAVRSEGSAGDAMKTPASDVEASLVEA